LGEHNDPSVANFSNLPVQRGRGYRAREIALNKFTLITTLKRTCFPHLQGRS